jgi:PAS domain S-box-containing protein
MPEESYEQLLDRIRDLEERLDESEQTLRAIRNGEIDAIVMAGPAGNSIYTLKGADDAYRQIVEGMTEGAITLAADGLILFSNERFAALVGEPLDQIIGSHIENLITRDDSDVLMALRSATLRSGKAEVRLRSQGGAPIATYFSWKRVQQDGLECVSIVVTDLSEQERNAQIVADEQLARSILEQTAEAMVVTDLAGKVIRASGAADDLAGVPVFQRNFDEVFKIRLHSGGGEHVLFDVKSCPFVERAEARAVMTDGRVLQILLTCAPLADPQGRRLGSIVTLIDVTARKQTEDALRASNEDLRQFAFAASHDLQEPLRMITTYTQFLVKEYRGQLDDNSGLYVKFITEGADRMRRLLEDLLAFSQLNEDGWREAQPVDLNRIFEKAVENCKTAIAESQAVVTSDPLPYVRGHESHFLQLFQNLIGNALKYRGQEPPRVHVSAKETDATCLLSVTDNGIGIDPKYHDGIFGVFKRLHGKEIPGTGIGLAICKRVVERAGGQIWVESKLNQGATFYCALPSASIRRG